jgi:hypothetical protein
MLMEYRKRLLEVIRRKYGVEAFYVLTVPVTEIHDGETVWSGDVSVFNLRGHPEAQRCYAWSYMDDNNLEQFSVVLGIPPVISAHAAVRSSIVPKVKNDRKET